MRKSFALDLHGEWSDVGKDPEIRATAGGMTVASFYLATADRQKRCPGQLGRQDLVAQYRLLSAHR